MEEKKGKGIEESKEGELKTYMVKRRGQDTGTIRWKDNQIKLDLFTIYLVCAFLCIHHTNGLRAKQLRFSAA